MAVTYPENSCPRLKGVASCKCVLPNFIILEKAFALESNPSLKASSFGSKLCTTDSTAEIFIAVGKVSFVD